jgi:hypothetical protein
MAAKKWDMAAAVASHLVKVDPQTAEWWIRAQAIHPKVAMIAFNLACYASVTSRLEEAKERLRHAIELDSGIRGLALDEKDLHPLWDWIGGLK